MEMYFSMARLRSRAYNEGDIITLQKKHVETVEGVRTRFYAYDDEHPVPYAILENSRFHALPQTKVMDTSFAATLPDTIEVTVIKANNPHGLVKVQYNAYVPAV